MKNQETKLPYANTDPSRHYNHSEPEVKADWRRIYTYCLKNFDYDAAELITMRNMVSDECSDGEHDLCNFAWCNCDHHSTVQFRLEHPPLRSLREVA